MFSRTCGVLLTASLVASAYGQGFACKQKTFEAKVNSGERFKHDIGTGLEVVLDPYKNDDGWMIRISPRGSDIDWSYPVNLPLDGEAQSLGSGWSSTAKGRLQGSKKLRFVLDASDFTRYSKLADDALHSPAPSGADDFIQQLKKGTFGSILLREFQFDSDGSADSVKWVKFTVIVTVPKSFEDRDGWQLIACDAPH